MAFDSKRKRGVYPTEVHFCNLCGGEIVTLCFANGTPYYTDVLQDHLGNRYIILGEGNHFNFKPRHDCAKRAAFNLELAEHRYEEFAVKHAAAKTLIEQMKQADKEMAENHMDDPQLLAAFERLRNNADANWKALEAQKPGMDGMIEQARTRAQKLAKGQSIIPKDQPAIGRACVVVKGRKVPLGTTGVIFWMGLDKFRDGVLVGIKSGDKTFYVHRENIELREDIKVEAS